MTKEQIISGWDTMRIIRAIIGVGLIILAFSEKTSIYGVMGGLFLFQAVLNIGCFGSASCNTNSQASINGNEIQDVKFEEIKTNNNGK
jgi:hypothetical protein